MCDVAKEFTDQLAVLGRASMYRCFNGSWFLIHCYRLENLAFQVIFSFYFNIDFKFCDIFISCLTHDGLGTNYLNSCLGFFEFNYQF
jgi:hypothetical protein